MIKIASIIISVEASIDTPDKDAEKVCHSIEHYNQERWKKIVDQIRTELPEELNLRVVALNSINEEVAESW